MVSFAYDDYDDRRITLGRGSMKIQQGPSEWVQVDCSKDIYTDPRLHRTGADYVARRALRFVPDVLSSTKWCAACGEFVGLRLFSDDPLTWDGLSAWCRNCELIRGQRPLTKLVELLRGDEAELTYGGVATSPSAHRRHFLYALRNDVTLVESAPLSGSQQMEPPKPARAGRKRQSERADRRAPYSTTGCKSR